MKYLITGGSGYLGGRLTAYLSEAGHEITVGSRKAAGRADSAFTHIDYSRPESLISALQGKEIVVHLAYPDEVEAAHNPAEALRAGGEYTWNLCRAICSLEKRPALIYVSTFHVYGRNAKGLITEETAPQPLHPYAMGKYFGETVVQLFRINESLKGLSVRLSNAFGKPQSLNITRWSLVFNDLCRQAVLNKMIKLNSAGLQKRNFITIEDTVRAIDYLQQNAAKWPQDGIINLGSSISISITEVADIVASRVNQLYGYKPLVSIPISPVSSDFVPANDFLYSSERIANMGFTWGNRLENEVDSTLKMIMEAKDEHPFF